MAISLNSTTQYLSVASSVIGSTPSAFTLACRINGAAQSGKAFIGFGNSGNNNPLLALMSGETGFSQSTSAIKLHIRNDSATVAVGSAAGDAAGTALDSTWRHVAATYSAGTANVYVDGTNVATISSITMGTVSLNTTAIGGLLRATPILLFSGAIARPCIYSVALTDGELDALSDGIAPDSIRPQSLLFYAPIIRNFQDLKGAVTITDNGPVTQSNSPRMFV